MTLEEIIEGIIAVRQQGEAPDKDVAEYLAAALTQAGARAEVQPFYYSL